jgi:hypothetical protein
MTPPKRIGATAAIAAAVFLFGMVATLPFRGVHSTSGVQLADKTDKSAHNVDDYTGSRSSVEGNGNISGPGRSDLASALELRFGSYDEYLDRICPRLTVAEEDNLIESSDDAKTLIGLLFAGSKRPVLLLKEALRREPNNPLVHYAILARRFPEFDHLQSALILAKLAPDYSTPLYAAALEALNSANREDAMSYLAKAAERSESSAFRTEALEAAINSFQLAGRSEDDARTRVLLQNNGQWEAVVLGDLRDALGIIGPDRKTLWGSDVATTTLLDASQKILNSPGFDLASYHAALADLTDYLEAIVEAQASRFDNYMSMPPAKWLDYAKAQDAELRPVLMFAHDKAGVYERLDKSQRVELIKRISQEGELPAFLWAYQTRPDIFRSAEFRPRTAHPRFWARYVSQ